MKTLFIGIGNRYRQDDGVAPALGDRLRARNIEGLEVLEASDDVIGLIDRWKGYDLVIVADAVSAGEAPGTIYRRDPLAAPIPTHWLRVSSHQLGITEAIEMGRAMKRLPRRMMFVGIEGVAFGHGEELTPEVAHGLHLAAEVIDAELREQASLMSR